MATAVIVTDLSEITDCDTDVSGGAWSGLANSEGASDPAPLEGVGWIGSVIKQADDSNIITFTPTSSIDMSGSHLRCPIMTILRPVLKTKALGGIQLLIAGSTSGNAIFNVSGGDFYTGGWEMLVCNPYATPDEGTQVVGNVASIGFNFKIIVAAKNIVTTQFDWMSYGTGFYVHGGTSSDMIKMSNIDAVDSYYLLCKLRKGVYRVSGKFQIGDSTGTNSTYFESPGDIVIFEDLDVDSDFYELNIAGNATGTTVVDLSGMFISSEVDKYSVDFTDSTNVDSITMDGTVFQKASTIDLSSVVDGNGTVIDQCEAVDPGGATLENVTIKNTEEATTGSFLVNVDTEAEACSNMAFQGYAANGRYAVYVAAAVTEFDMDNWQFDDPDNTVDYAVYWLGTSGTLVINALNGTNLTSAGCLANTGGSITVIANQVTTKVHVTDDQGDDLQNARVYLAAADGAGDYPFEDTVTITRSGTLATVSHTAHGLATGGKVKLSGITDKKEDNSGVHTITYIGVNSYSYPTTDSGSTSYTGTIKATGVIIEGLTDVNGDVSLLKSWTLAQAVTGLVRKSTGSPYFKTSQISGDISTDSGLTINVQLIPDE